jgi:hypothetical protein
MRLAFSRWASTRKAFSRWASMTWGVLEVGTCAIGMVARLPWAVLCSARAHLAGAGVEATVAAMASEEHRPEISERQADAEVTYQRLLGPRDANPLTTIRS